MPVDVSERTTATSPHSVRRPFWMFLAGFVVVILSLAAYTLGTSHPRQTTHRGVPYVGVHVVSWQIGDTYYGFSEGGVPWLDSADTLHLGNWPDCLRQGTTSVVPFDTVKVTYPDGGRGDQVVWVDCS